MGGHADAGREQLGPRRRDHEAPLAAFDAERDVVVGARLLAVLDLGLRHRHLEVHVPHEGRVAHVDVALLEQVPERELRELARAAVDRRVLGAPVHREAHAPPDVAEGLLVLGGDARAQVDEVRARDHARRRLALRRLLRERLEAQPRVAGQGGIAAHVEQVLHAALGGHAVVVPAHRVEDVAAAHALEARHHVGLAEAERVADVERARDRERRRVHREAPRGRGRVPVVDAALLPGFVPTTLRLRRVEMLRQRGGVQRRNSPCGHPARSDGHSSGSDGVDDLRGPHSPFFSRGCRYARPAMARDFVTVVTGPPRSGTSLLMQLLAAGGIPALSDGARAPDASNPRGYLEHRSLRGLGRDPAAAALVRGAAGRALKLVHVLAPTLPAGPRYRVLLAERALGEVVASQDALLARGGSGAGELPPAGAGELPPERLAAILRAQLDEAVAALAGRPDIALLRVDTAALVREPGPACAAIDAFLGGGLDRLAMQRAVAPGLWGRSGYTARMSGDLVETLGPVRLVVEHRSPGPAGGPTLRIQRAADGHELLRFDCFAHQAHWHLDPDGRDEITPIPFAHRVSRLDGRGAAPRPRRLPGEGRADGCAARAHGGARPRRARAAQPARAARAALRGGAAPAHGREVARASARRAARSGWRTWTTRWPSRSGAGSSARSTWATPATRCTRGRRTCPRSSPSAQSGATAGGSSRAASSWSARSCRACTSRSRSSRRPATG